MVQLAPAASGSPFGHHGYVPRMDYAYDVNARNGQVSATVKVNKIDGTPIKGPLMGRTRICPVETGACVVSATGGTITGYDMYGQYVKEVVGAAGTSKIAFAQIVSAPTDAQWTNNFGLPYKYLGAGTPAWGLGTITGPSAVLDARGTFALTVPPTAPAEVKLSYLADLTNLMGDPYSARTLMKTTEPATTLAVTATINPTTGVTAVTVPVSTPAGVKTTVTFPDGHTERGVAGTVMNYTLSPVWMSQYADTIAGAAANKLIAVGFDGNFIKSTYATVTGMPAGFMAMAMDAPEPQIAPQQYVAAPPEPPASFNTHAAADAWLDTFLSATGADRPADWDGQTLSGKRTTAQDLSNEWGAQDRGVDAG